MRRNSADPRRSEFLEAEEARQFAAEELATNEPITVILSAKGWVRSAKGHEIDADSLSYRAGDELCAFARGRTNDTLLFFDSTGRSYAVAAHTLPSSRGQGEPLTGRLNPPEGARFIGTVIGSADDELLLASDAGYGFVGTIGALTTKNRAGKAALNVPKDSQVMTPAHIAGKSHVAAATNRGHLLVFPIADLPQLSRGKGNKIINIPAAALKARGGVPRRRRPDRQRRPAGRARRRTQNALAVQGSGKATWANARGAAACCPGVFSA